MKTSKLTLWGLLALAIPSILSQLLNNAFRIIDQYCIQWLGAPAQAALGATSFVLIAAFSMFMLIGGGIGALVGRATGANEPESRTRFIGQSLRATVFIAIAYCVILVLTAPYLPELVGLSGTSAEMMTSYLSWLGYTGFFLAFGPVIDAIYISMGNTKFPMLLQLLATVVNLCLNYFLIYTLGFGIAGAAIASGVSRGLASAIGLYYIQRDFAPKWSGSSEVRRMIRIGTPISLGILSYALVYWALLRTSISPLGEPVTAALGIGFSALESISWPIFAGIMLAASSLVSRQLGAKDYEGLDRTLKLSFPASTTLGLIISALFYWGGETFCSFFTNDPIVLEQAAMYAQILAFSQVFVAWETLSEGILEGAGDTKVILWFGMPFNVLRIPLSWFLAIYLGWGAFGIWWTINITTYIKALLKMWVVSRGKWRTLEI